ncbi:hypothetical protein JCM11641_001103 [Rhodosporidiobolus odoratus]
MSSYLNSLPPPPPPPRANPGAPPPADTSQPITTSSPAKRGHKHTQSTHWNDTPDLAALARSDSTTSNSGVARSTSRRERVASRVTPLPSIPPSSALTTPPQPPTGKTLAGEAILPAFNAPPPPPPEPALTQRYGPRGLPADLLHFPPLLPTASTATATAASHAPQPEEGKGENGREAGRLVILFIPGNPGLVEYYRSFLSSLRSALPSPLRERTELFALGHLGHSAASRAGGGGGGFKPSEQAGLEEQVEDKIRFLEELRGSHGVGKEGGARVVVVGHSIGAWMGLQVLKERPHLITALLSLFPTLSHMSKTPNGRSLSPLFSSWTLRPVFYSASALSYLPPALTSKLVGLITGHSGSGAEVTSQLVASPQSVLAALTLAKEELATVKELDEEAIRNAAGKMWVYYAQEGKDGWVTSQCMSEVGEVLERSVGKEGREKRVKVCGEGMPHAFVLDEAHSASLARKCATWIVEDLQALDASAPPSSSSDAVPPRPPPATTTV